MLQKKRQNVAGFSAANSRKNRPILQEKSQNLETKRPISQDFSGKKANFEGFSGQILRKIGRFHGKFRGKLPQETIRKKQQISLDFFGKFRYNQSILRRYDQRLTFF